MALMKLRDRDQGVEIVCLSLRGRDQWCIPLRITTRLGYVWRNSAITVMSRPCCKYRIPIKIVMIYVIRHVTL
jgi:hypothetical protein